MRTCSLCRAKSPDAALACLQCGADLSEHSSTAVALKNLKENPRVGNIRVIAAEDACPTCRAATAEYEKDVVPDLPVKGCSHALGCRCFYEPMIEVLYP